MKHVLHVGALVRFLKSGSLGRITKVNGDGTFMVSQKGARSETPAAGEDFEKISECTCCDRRIDRGREVWLEHDAVTDLFHRPGEVPEGRGDGVLFPLGATCARKHLAAAAKSYRTKP